MVEFDLAKILERIEVSLSKVVETQTRLEGDVKSLQKGQDDLKNEVKEVRNEVKEIRNDIKGRISNQGYWFLSLLTVLVGIIFKLAFWPNP